MPIVLASTFLERCCHFSLLREILCSHLKSLKSIRIYICIIKCISVFDYFNQLERRQCVLQDENKICRSVHTITNRVITNQSQNICIN